MRAGGGAGNQAKSLRHALDKHIALPGFQYSVSKALATAKFDALCELVMSSARSRPPLLEAILRAWVESEAELKHAVRAALAQHDIALAGMKQGISVPPEPALATVLLELQETLPGRKLEDIHLMVACESGQFPLSAADTPDAHAAEETDDEPGTDCDAAPDDADHSANGASNVPFPTTYSSQTSGADGAEGEGMQWHSLLGELAHLPAEAAEWDDENVGGFVAAVQALAAQKRDERVAGHLVLQQAIETLRSEQAEAIEFHDLGGIASWEAENVPRQRARAAASDVAQLCTALAEESALRHQQSQLKKRREQEAFQPAIQKLCEQIDQRYQALHVLFASDSAAGPGNNQANAEPRNGAAEEPAVSTLSETSAAPAPTPDTSRNGDAGEGSGNENIAEDITPVEAPREIAPAIAAASTANNNATPAESSSAQSDDLPASQELAAADGSGKDVESQEAAIANDASQSLPAFAEEPQSDISATVEEWQGSDEADIPDSGADSLLVLAAAEAEQEDTPAADADVQLRDEGDSEAGGDSPAKLHEQLGSEADQAIAAPAEADPEAVFWQLIDEDEMALAYWMARSIEAHKDAPPVPSELIAAVFGARQVTFDHAGVGPLVDDLADIVLAYEPEHSVVSELLTLAAALRPTLLAPTTGMVEWIKVPSYCPTLHGCTQAIREFAQHGIGLQELILSDVTNVDAKQRHVVEAAEQAQRWYHEAQTFKISYVPASIVWKKLIAANGPLADFLLKVGNNQRDSYDEVETALKSWNDEDFRNKQINDIDRALRKTNWEQIKYEALDQLHHNITDACGYAERWCRAVEHVRRIETEGDWLFRQISQLQARLRQALPDAWAAIEELTANHTPVAPASRCLQRALADCLELLHIPLPGDVARKPSVAATPNQSLQKLLASRLWLLPQIDLDTQLQPTPEALLAAAATIAQPACWKNSAATAISGWLKREDFRVVAGLRAQTDEEIVSEIDQQIAEARQNAAAKLRLHVRATSDKVALAYQDAVLDEAVQTEYVAVVTQIDEQPTDNFPDAHARLAEIELAVEQTRAQRRAELEQSYHTLRPELATRTNPNAQAEIERSVKQAMQGNDIRIIEELLDSIQSIINGNTTEETWWLSQTEQHFSNTPHSYFSIRPELARIAKEGLPQAAEKLKQGSLHATLTIDSSATEGATALTAWKQLKQTPAKLNIIALKTILGFLGIENTNTFEVALKAPTLRRNWAHARVELKQMVNARPIAEFGSRARQYDIICLESGVESIATSIQRTQIDTQVFFLFYFGTLSAQQLRDIGRLSRSKEKRLTIIALDEPLLLFLAHEADRALRFQVLLHCALAYTALNPFVPYCRGLVPAEMFYGREDLITELQAPAGRCIIYGGRQFGKTALLNETRRRFELKPEQRAWVEDILNIGASPDQPPSSIWLRLRSIFRDHLRLIPAQVKTDRTEDIIGHIRKSLNQNEGRRVLIMFDEADSFLSADGREDFRTVSELRRLIMDTQERFKVVFSGLHSVQRFAAYPNNPLAQFGLPICIGPMPANIARDVIEQPLAALGYTFRDANSILRILSYTGYHAGLLQIYGDALIQYLMNRVRAGEPPYYIEQQDVDQTYLRMKNMVVDRFKLTLRLNTYYRAIAMVFIWEQYESRTYGTAYTANDVLRLGSEYWPAGFTRIDDEMINSLLDEMTGLGILVRTRSNSYRLRSPNIVRLMASESDVFDAVAAFQNQEPPDFTDIDSHHAILEQDAISQHYSPLTYAQTRLLNAPRSGVSLVFGSSATGIDTLTTALSRFASLNSDSGVFTPIIPLSVLRGRRLAAWLAEQRKSYTSHDRLVYTARVEGTADELQHLLEAALTWAEGVSAHEPHVSVFLIFGPQATTAWLQIASLKRQELESRVTTLVSLQPWNTIAVRQRLLHNDLWASHLEKQVIDATGGWAVLLDELIGRCTTSGKVAKTIEDFQGEVRQPGSKLARLFNEKLELNDGAARRILQFISDEFGGSVTTDFLTPEFIDDKLSQDICDAALLNLERMACIKIQRDESSGVFSVSVDPIVRAMVVEP